MMPGHRQQPRRGCHWACGRHLWGGDADVTAAHKLGSGQGQGEGAERQGESAQGQGRGEWGGGESSAGSCAACLVCYECCASGWVPGCGGYGDILGDAAAAGAAMTSEQASQAARSRQADLADALGYVLDPGQTALIDQRLGRQYQQTMATMAARMQHTRRLAQRVRLRDQRASSAAKRWQHQAAMRAAIKGQERVAQELPLDSIARSPVTASALPDPWSQFRSFESGQLGRDVTLPANHA